MNPGQELLLADEPAALATARFCGCCMMQIAGTVGKKRPFICPTIRLARRHPRFHAIYAKLKRMRLVLIRPNQANQANLPSHRK
ncbi:MAG: hypothetical protein H6668_12610 [Ardenticatenaceae bacterium]|nr:hypothetical protein [Ardenticatenaceae bacterium]